MAILTLAEYKTRKGISSPNMDAILTPLIDSVNALITTYCGQDFSEQTVTDYLTVDPDGVLLLETLPVVSITSVEYGSSFGTYDSVYPATGYYLDKKTGILELLDPTVVVLPSHRRAFKVVYTCGYATVPEDIKLSAVELTTHYKDREFKKTIQSSSGESVEFESGKLIPAQVKMVLDNYRRL